MIAPEVIAEAQRRVGQTLCGKWRLDRVIGVGGMASVYEATHRNKNRVAIKLLHPVLSLEAGSRQRFLREGYVANTIDHRGAVRILDDDLSEDGSAFIVMELLDGYNVEQLAARRGGVLPPREALAMMDQLLDLLSVAHDQGVIHRDIKPDNLFWTDEGELKLLDFGIARLRQADYGMTTVGSFMGTPAYSAPEQARGRWDEVDERTDLYAVGATLFTLLTGEHVHLAETSSEQLALAISAPARSLAQVAPGAPPELVQLVDNALAYEKADRFQSARVFRAAVQRVWSAIPDRPLFQEAVDRRSFSARTWPAVPRGWARLGSPFVRVLLGAAAAVGLALLLLRLGPTAPRSLPAPSLPRGPSEAEGLARPAAEVAALRDADTAESKPPDAGPSRGPSGEGSAGNADRNQPGTQPADGRAVGRLAASGVATSRQLSPPRSHGARVQPLLEPGAGRGVAGENVAPSPPPAAAASFELTKEEEDPAQSPPAQASDGSEDLFDRRY